jgi:Ring finger domain
MFTLTTLRAVVASILFATAVCQTVAPSNSSQDIYPVSTSPRFLLNGTEMSNIPPVGLAPLGDYGRLSHRDFVRIDLEAHLYNVNAFNVEDYGSSRNPPDEIAYISCDPEDYTNSNLDASYVFVKAVNSPRSFIVILYSKTSDHCSSQGLDSLQAITGILTTTEPVAATMLANLNLTLDSPGTVTLLPDLNSYTNFSNSGVSNGLGQSPTTAVAMIILYSITGIITALFVVIIITGAIRAHRHPERYGPRSIIGRGRQSRARGIARAMLDTLPIVKFGDRLDPKVDPAHPDVELNPVAANQTDGTSRADPNNATPSGDGSAGDTASNNANADGADDAGQLGCSICTEDFIIGEEVRVLPCNHKYHPDCVDPWLLNVSGTCPLCRIDLRPQGEEGDNLPRLEGADDELPPPLGGTTDRNGSVSGPGGENHNLRRDTITQLRRMAAGSNEDRMAALRRYRQERRSRRGTARENEADDGERRGIASRLRERFRVRTERRGATTNSSEPVSERPRRGSPAA